MAKPKSKPPKSGAKNKTTKTKKVDEVPNKKKTVAKTVKSVEKRNFVLLNDKNEDVGRYTGKAPRQAALKVANTGVTNIRLRETGIRRKVNGITEIKIHVFKGSRKQRKKTAADPAWLPDKINYPAAKKVGVEWVAWSS